MADCKFILQFGNGREVKCQKERYGEDPTDGPNQVQDSQVGNQGEYDIDPYKTN